MPVKVIDASVVSAILFAEPGSEAVARRLEHHALVAPSLWTYEVGNVCLQKIRRHRPDRQVLLDAFSLASRLGIEEVDVPVAQVVPLADEVGLTVYDAAYVWLARMLRAELVTLDTALARVMARS